VWGRGGEKGGVPECYSESRSRPEKKKYLGATVIQHQEKNKKKEGSMEANKAKSLRIFRHINIHKLGEKNRGRWVKSIRQRETKRM